MFDHEGPMVYIMMPLIKHLEFDFDYNYKFLGFTPSGHVKAEFNDTMIVAAVELTTTSKGHLYPQVRNIHIDLRKSQIFETNSVIM